MDCPAEEWSGVPFARRMNARGAGLTSLFFRNVGVYVGWKSVGGRSHGDIVLAPPCPTIPHPTLLLPLTYSTTTVMIE